MITMQSASSAAVKGADTAPDPTPSISAATDGTRIVVRPGTYRGFTIVGKSLSVFGEPGVRLTSNPLTTGAHIAVFATNANQPVVVTDIQVDDAHGVLAGFGIPTTVVTATVWKRDMKLNQDKELSRKRAIELFPAFATMFARKKDHNRAEAALLAVWLERQLRNGA